MAGEGSLPGAGRWSGVAFKVPRDPHPPWVCGAPRPAAGPWAAPGGSGPPLPAGRALEGAAGAAGGLGCGARRRVGPLGAAGARGVPAKSFCPFTNEGVRPGHQQDVAGHRGAERGPRVSGDRGVQPNPPSREKSGPGSVPPVPLAQEKGRRSSGGPVTKERASNRRGFSLKAFLFFLKKAF